VGGILERVRGTLIAQQNRGALARQEFVSMLPVVLLGFFLICFLERGKGDTFINEPCQRVARRLALYFCFHFD